MTVLRRCGLIAALLAAMAASAGAPAQELTERSGGLQAFRSEAELRAFLRARLPRPRPAAYEDQAVEAVVVTGNRVSDPPSITNAQEAGVDEGGIVKLHGEHLLILRRGRLFTVALTGGGLRAVDSIDAYPPGVDADGDWYDEMLVAGDRVVIIGFSYGRGGTEINRFRITADGRLRFEDAHHLRSNDYYSSRNYASRLIGRQLVVYTPLELSWSRDLTSNLPGLRRWTGDEKAAFRPIASARQIYMPPPTLRGRGRVEALHTVIRCDLTAPVLDCRATGVLGPESRSSYVSGRAAYLWLSDYDPAGRSRPAVAYRLPLDGGRPGAVLARGAPTDQFSFREDPDSGTLDVLLRSESRGDAMWRPEFSEGAVALLRLPLQSFGDGRREAGPERYRPLPPPHEDAHGFRNRFVGRHVLYGFGRDWEEPGPTASTLVAAPVQGGPVRQLPLPHSVDRIEALGADALVVGSRGEDTVLTAVELEGGGRLGHSHLVPSASEGETRSHAFFFRPDTPDGASGVMGLPVTRAARPAYGERLDSSAAMLFLARRDRRLTPLGELAAAAKGARDDGCKASCVDWYGDARPIFLGPRAFALLGYELVEGRLTQAGVQEVRRIDFSPPASGLTP